MKSKPIAAGFIQRFKFQSIYESDGNDPKFVARLLQPMVKSQRGWQRSQHSLPLASVNGQQVNKANGTLAKLSTNG
jgi:hypothetical protein